MFCMAEGNIIIWQAIILKCTKITLVKQNPSGLESTCKNNVVTSRIKQGFALNMEKGCKSRRGSNKTAAPPGRHQEQAPKQRRTFSSTTLSSVQFYSVQRLALEREGGKSRCERLALGKDDTL